MASRSLMPSSAPWRPPGGPCSCRVSRSRSGSRRCSWSRSRSSAPSASPGLVVPLVSMAAAVTLQPALLSLLGRRAQAATSRATSDRAQAARGHLAAARGEPSPAGRSPSPPVRSSCSCSPRPRRVAPADPGICDSDPAEHRRPRGPRAAAGAGRPGDHHARSRSSSPPEGARRGMCPCGLRGHLRLATALSGDPEAFIVSVGTVPPYVDSSGVTGRSSSSGAMTSVTGRARSWSTGSARPRSPQPASPRGRACLRRGRPGAGRGLPRPGLRLAPVDHRARPRAGVPLAAPRVPLALAAAHGGRCSTCSRSPPPTGCSWSCSASASAPTCSASTASRRSRAGCPCSSSRCSSDSRWTTRSSSSRGCGSPGTPACDNEARHHRRPRPHRPGRQRRGAHHGRSALGARVRAHGGAAGARRRPRARGPARRDGRAGPADAEPDGPVRAMELVAPRPVARLMLTGPRPSLRRGARP